MTSPNHIVLVSGAPGAGKTTLARPLAIALGFSLISKDTIKETLFDALDGPVGDFAFSRRIGGAAMELLWTLAAACPRVILEANFRPHSDLERRRLATLKGSIVEVYCQCPPQLAAQRFAARAARPDHHPAHPGTHLTAEQLAEFDRPIGIAPVIQVDTTQPVDTTHLAHRILHLLDH